MQLCYGYLWVALGSKGLKLILLSMKYNGFYENSYTLGGPWPSGPPTKSAPVDTVRNALAGEVEIDQVRYFSDSKTVLSWIANRNEWKVFVKHRVNEILKWSKKEDWGYCPSAENPADVGSRGVGAHGLMETELWWNGPRWLRTPGQGFPTPPVEIETEESSLEMKKSCIFKVSIEETTNVESIMEIEKFSSLNRLYRVTAYVGRFMYNLRAKQKGVQRKNGELGRDEMIGAERMWILAAQARLKNQDNYAGLVKELKIVEYNGLLKCRGRLNNYSNPSYYQGIIV